MGNITDEEELFASTYLVNLDPVEAYRAIHPDAQPGTFNSHAYRYLRRPRVRKLIRTRMAKIAGKLEHKAEDVLQELARLAFSNMSDYVVIQDDGTAIVDLAMLTPDELAAVQEITVDEYVEGKGDEARNVKRVKLKLADKGVNLERLGRYYKLFTEVVEHKGLEALAERMTKARKRVEGDNADLA